MTKEFMTHIWGLSIFYNKKNRYTKRWKVGEFGNWEFKNRKEALSSIDSNMIEVEALMYDMETIQLSKPCKIKVHKTQPKYTESKEHLQDLKPYPLYEDTPLPLPGTVLGIKIPTCFKKHDENIYVEL